MIEAYAIGMSLTLNPSTVLGPLADIMAALEKVQNAVKTTQSGITGMASSMRGAATAAQSFAAAMERAAAASTRFNASGMAAAAGGGAAGGARGGPSGYVGPTYLLSGPASRMALPSPGPQLLLGGPGGGSGGGWNNLPPNLRGGGAPGGAFFTTPRIMGAYFGYEGMKSIFDAVAEKDKISAGLIAQGFTPAQAQQAYQQAIDVQQSIPGSGILGNMTLQSQLMTVLQRPDEAMATMPAMARLGVILSSLGIGAQGGDMMNAIRAGELHGALTKSDPKTGAQTLDPAGLVRFANEVAAAAVVSHGQIGPAQIVQFLRSGGVSARMLSDESLFADSIALQMSMGSANAGTALQGLGMQFSSGRMSQAAVNLLAQMGIIHDRSKVLKAGMGQYILMPGAMSLADVQLGRDSPRKFIMDVLLPGIKGWLHKEYGAAYDTADPAHQLQMEQAAGQTIASRIPGGKEIAQTMQDVMLMARDREAVNQALGRDPLAIEMAYNPQLRMAALTESFKAFETAMGDNMMGTAISTLNSLTVTLNSLGDFARNNPTLFQMMLGAGIGAAVGKSPQGGVVGAILGLGSSIWDANPLGLNTPLYLSPHFPFITATPPGGTAPDGSPIHLQSYAPGGSAGGAIQMRGDVTFDGRKVGQFMAASLATGLSGPRSTPALPDLRSSPYASHGMAAA
jgi:hypothetical protein